MKHLVGGLFLMGVTAFASLTGCYSNDSSVGGEDPDPDPGAECGVIGERVTEADGCTECVCTEMGWSCDSADCNVECTDGDSQPAGDGCNTCFCVAGEWSCTLIGCQECMPGAVTSFDGCNECSCTSDGSWACTDMACPPICTEGEMRAAGDGCNECTCMSDGSWSCTQQQCMGCGFLDQAAPDPCTTCECLEDGTFVCTAVSDCESDCPAPQMPPDDTSCPAVTGVARNPMTGSCCEYATACTAPAGWEMFNTLDECQLEIVCDAGLADCDGDPDNGCETNIESDVQNCGSCGSTCMTPPDAMTYCAEGTCQISSIPRGTCLYGGVQYQPDESFPSRDGCNTCTCSTSSGRETVVSCTEIACGCDAADEPYRNYAANSPEACTLIFFGCPNNTTGFANDCGCGCEQSYECPETIDCTGATMTCNEPLAARCPYTVVMR